MALHLNGFVDVISKAFLDVVIQPGQQPDEREALHSMLDHFTPDDPQKYIITADRGYESNDLLFHCELKNLGYVFRVKSPSSPKSILSYYASEFPDDLEEFDVTIKRFFTDKATNIMKSQSGSSWPSSNSDASAVRSSTRCLRGVTSALEK